MGNGVLSSAFVCFLFCFVLGFFVLNLRVCRIKMWDMGKDKTIVREEKF